MRACRLGVTVFFGLFVGLIAGGAVPARSQTPADERIAFDVVSVKPNRSGDANLRLDLAGGRFTAVNVPLKQFVRAAYTLQLYQIEGAPRWTEAERFDVTGVTGRDISGPVVWTPGTHAPMQRMMQSVLADRFGMKARMAARDLQGYALEVRPAGSGGRLVTAAAPCTAAGGADNAPGVARWRCAPLAHLAELLSQVTGRRAVSARPCS